MTPSDFVRCPWSAAMVLLVAQACSTSAQPVTSAGASKLALSRPMTLAVTALQPGEVAGWRIVGGIPNTVVTVFKGSVGGTTCPVELGATCLDLVGAHKLGTAIADDRGDALLEQTLSPHLRVGKVFAYQAAVTDLDTGLSDVSNVVERTTVDAAAAVEPPLTNVLVVLLDDVGIDRIGLYGAERPAHTPTLDLLASAGLLFENAWSMPVCSGGRAALQTGRYARRTGVGTNPAVGAGSRAQLDPDLITIAEVVDHSPWASYASSYVGKWHLTAEGSSGGTLGPVDQGWDWWSGSMGNIGNYTSWDKVDPTGAVQIETTYATTDNVDDALDRLAVMTEPWLLQVSFNAAHQPYHAPPADLHTDTDLDDSDPDPDLVRAMIEAADTEVGRLLAGIPVDVLDRTTVFYTADNGTMTEALEADEPNWGRAKGSLYDGGVRVPFVVTGPLVGVPGSRTQVLAHVVDVFPTIAEIAGVDTTLLRGSLDPTVPATLDGYSLVATLADPVVSSGRTRNFAERFEPGGGGPYRRDTRALSDGTYKIVVDTTCVVEEFFELTPGAINEGLNLLPGGLTAEQQIAYDQLRDELTELVASMPYDADTWPLAGAVVPICDPF